MESVGTYRRAYIDNIWLIFKWKYGKLLAGTPMSPTAHGRRSSYEGHNGVLSIYGQLHRPWYWGFARLTEKQTQINMSRLRMNMHSHPWLKEKGSAYAVELVTNKLIKTIQYSLDTKGGEMGVTLFSRKIFLKGLFQKIMMKHNTKDYKALHREWYFK